MKKVFVLSAFLFIFYNNEAQVAPKSYSIIKSFGNGNIADFVHFGSISNTGLGTYAKVRATTHSCGQLFIAEYEFYGNYYAGSSVGWVEVPVRNGNDWNGTQNLALDVKLAADNTNFEVRLRRLVGGCIGYPIKADIYIETNSNFTELNNTGTETLLPSGYLGNTSGWKFPVTSDRFFATTSGMFINNNGRIGIGTINPATRLNIMGTHPSTQFRMTLPAIENGLKNGDISLQAWVSEPGVIWDGGGIGMNVNNDGGANGFGRLNGNIGQSFIRFLPNGGAMQFNTTANNGTYYPNTMYLADGKLGVGTSSPKAKLQVNAGLNRNLLIRSAAELSTNTSGIGIQSVNDDNSANLPMELESSVLLLNAATQGNVGIGTTTPSSWGKLTIGGNLVFANDATDYLITGPANGGAIRIKSNGATPDRYLQLGQIDNNKIFYPYLTAANNSYIGIGTTTPKEMLSVKGTVLALKVKILAASAPEWADYVFKKGYKLPSLSDVENFIQKHSHLPEVPSAEEVQKDGLDLAETQAVLLKKIEELTLYLIEQGKALNEQNNKIQSLQKQVNKLR